jgi:hypothetical protein
MNTLFAIHRSGRLICAWIPTGDRKSPLIRVWFEDHAPRAAAAMPSSDKEPAGLRLCA